MKNQITTTATPTTSCIVMPALCQDSALGAPVQGGRMAAGTTAYVFGVHIAPATFKDVSTGVRAWNPPD
jgi:hypothetical protein